MRSYITTLLLATTLILVSCGGGNDVASSGATAVSAATIATTNDASTTASTPTEPKVNGQVDERTGVAPMVAQMTIAQTVTACEASINYGVAGGPHLTDITVPTIYQCFAALPGYAFSNGFWTPALYGGCARSSSFGGSEPWLTLTQKSVCILALNSVENLEQCLYVGGKSWTVGKGSGGCDAGLVVQTETVTVPDYSNGGCARSSSFGGSEPALTPAQMSACVTAVSKASTFKQCFSLGGAWESLPEKKVVTVEGERTGDCVWAYKWY